MAETKLIRDHHLFTRDTVKNVSGDLTLDIDRDIVIEAGRKLDINASSDITLDSGGSIILDADGANITFKDGGTTTCDFVANGATSITLDAPGNIILDTAGGEIQLDKSGTEWLRINELSGGAVLRGMVSDADFKIIGNDGGSATDMLVFDVSAAGAATFNSTVIAAGGQLTTTGKAMVLGF